MLHCKQILAGAIQSKVMQQTIFGIILHVIFYSTHCLSEMKEFPATPKGAGHGLTCVDIFSGAGGLAEGFRQAGFHILSGSDIDPFASQTFRANFPEASFFEGNISDLKGADIFRLSGAPAGEIGCLIGGPPCQAFSYNNHLRTHRGAIAGLFREYLRLVEELNPRYLVMENVPGILSVGNGRVVGEIISRLGSLGYDTEARIVYAEDFGVPQERRRMIFVASRAGFPTNIFPLGSHGPAPKPATNEQIHRWQGIGRKIPSPLVRVWSAIGYLPTEPAASRDAEAPPTGPALGAGSSAMLGNIHRAFSTIMRSASARSCSSASSISRRGDRGATSHGGCCRQE